MAVNARIENTLPDVGYSQLAASQAARTNFTPGKKTASASEANWTTDHRIPTGTPAFDEANNGPAVTEHVRVAKLGRNIMDDQAIAAPISSGTSTVTITSAKEWGATTPVYVLTKTATKSNPAKGEKDMGFNSTEQG